MPHQCLWKWGEELAAQRGAEQLNQQHQLQAPPVPPFPTSLLGTPAWPAPQDSAGGSWGLGCSRAPDSPEDSILLGWLLGRLAGFGDHVSDFLQAVCQVPELVAAALGGEDQLSQPVDLVLMLQETRAEPAFPRGKAWKRLRRKEERKGPALP